VNDAIHKERNVIVDFISGLVVVLRLSWRVHVVDGGQEPFLPGSEATST
jgi:hypothetical protein